MRALPRPSLLSLAAIGGLCALAVLPAPDPAPDAEEGSGGCTVLRVVDGDTVEMTCPGEGRFRARLTGYDTPETHAPRCAAEAQAGAQATARLRMLLREAGRIDARLGGTDRFDRRLVALRLDGRDVGATLIAEGLARPYAGGPRPDWCAVLG